MTTLTASVARQSFPELLNRAAYGGERIAIARHGKVLAVIVPAEDLELLERLEDAADAKAVRAARRDYAKHGGITLAEFERKLNAKANAKSS